MVLFKSLLMHVRKQACAPTARPTSFQEAPSPWRFPLQSQAQFPGDLCVLAGDGHNYRLGVIPVQQTREWNLPGASGKLSFTLKRDALRNFPDGPVVNTRCFHRRGPGSIRGRGIKIPHARGQLSPCVTTREASTQQQRSWVLPLRPRAAQNEYIFKIKKRTKDRRVWPMKGAQ